MDFDESLNKVESEVLNALSSLPKVKTKRKTKLKNIKDIDPITLAALLYARLETQESTNLLLKNIYAKIEQLENEIKNVKEQKESKTTSKKSYENENIEEIVSLLPEKDKKILEIIRKNGRVSADDIKTALGYKGRNAASARLNKLYNLGLLTKVKFGRKVYYKLNAGVGKTTILNSF